MWIWCQILLDRNKMRYLCGWKFMIIFLVLGSLLNLSAHPNVTINYRIFLKFKGLFVTDVGESWTFDKTTSKELMEKYNLKDSPLDKTNSALVGKKVMDGLEELRYFTYISVDGRDLGKLKASGFKAQITDGTISVAFNNQLNSPLDLTKKHLSIQIKDMDELVITNLVEKNPVILIGANKKDCRIDIEEVKEENMGGIKEEDLFIDLLPLQKKIDINCK